MPALVASEYKDKEHTMKLEITGFEDRSGLPEPCPQSFGYIYFNDRTRIGFAPGVEGSSPVWEPKTNGEGKYTPVTRKHLRMALALLREKGVVTDEMLADYGVHA